MEKKINIVGGVGKNERQNRDRHRVMGGGGIAVSMCAHDDKEPPLALKRWNKAKQE
jgi:hypothetical protein